MLDKEYFYDSVGRFYVDKETQEKMYQIAPCCSSYKLQNDAFVKHTKDCGHSERRNEQCRMLVRDPTAVVMLPPIEPVDIKGRKYSTRSTEYEAVDRRVRDVVLETLRTAKRTNASILPCNS